MPTAEPLSQYLPQNIHGSVLITSRDKQIALRLVDNLPNRLLETEKLDSEEFLAIIPSKLSPHKTSAMFLEAFTSMLGDIPLALTQDFAGIEASELMSVHESCEKLRESEYMQ